MGTTRLTPRPKSCGLYLPGHEVHWIQGIHSSDRGETSPVPCRVLEIRDDGTVVIDLSGERLELWNHDPVRLRAIVEAQGAEGSYQEHWRLFRIPHEEGAYCVDVTPASNPERRPCPAEPPRHETLFEQMTEAGGFTVRAADLFAAVDRLEAAHPHGDADGRDKPLGPRPER